MPVILDGLDLLSILCAVLSGVGPFSLFAYPGPSSVRLDLRVVCCCYDHNLFFDGELFALYPFTLYTE